MEQGIDRAIIVLNKAIGKVDDKQCEIIEKSSLEELRKLINELVESLGDCPSDGVRHGIASGLLEFDRYLKVMERHFNKAFKEL